MKKTLLYVLLLLVFALGVWYFIFRDTNPFGGSDSAFTIRDTAAIGKIFLSRTDGQSVTLERSAGGWIVNGNYPVLPYAINNLLTTLNRQEAQSPVSVKAHNAVVTSLAGNSIKVEVYDRSDKKMRVFYVGGEATDLDGTYMLMEGASRPYVVTISAFTGYLTPRYSTELAQWRDRTIFNIAPGDIRSVAVKYFQDTLNSFTVQQDKDGKVSVALNPVLRLDQPLNEKRVRDFLGFFRNINCESFMNGLEGMDTVLRTVPPKATIDLTDKDGKTTHVLVYWRPLDRRSKNLLTPKPGQPEEFDADRLYAVIHDGKDTVGIQNYVFDKIFRRGFQFYQQTVVDPLPVLDTTRPKKNVFIKD